MSLRSWINWAQIATFESPCECCIERPGSISMELYGNGGVKVTGTQQVTRSVVYMSNRKCYVSPYRKQRHTGHSSDGLLSPVLVSVTPALTKLKSYFLWDTGGINPSLRFQAR